MTRPQSLFGTVLGEEFECLPQALQRFHSFRGEHRLDGWVETDEPETRPARLLARCLGTPRRAASGPLRFEIRAAATREIWTRHLPGSTLSSRLSARGSTLVERVGPVRLDIELRRRDDTLDFHVVRIRVLGLPWPRGLAPEFVATETAVGDRLHFRVRVAVRLLGTLASYHGHLDLRQPEAR